MDDESRQMHVDSLNIQVSNHQSFKDCLPVIKHAGSSGKGFPYAPEGFPSPGDVWTWRVGRRYTHAGFWQDRSVHPPDRLQSSTGNRMLFRGRASLEQYIRKTFPDADVDAFFASFVWKIPCTDVAKDASLKIIKSTECSKSAAIVQPAYCKASNEMCRIKAKTGSALTPATCKICCSEPNFCRNCCCILCYKTIDWIYDCYSFIKCEALVDEKFICGHVAHIECALRAYLAGKVGGSIDLDAQYYCRCCDNKTDLLLHVEKIIKVSKSIDNRDDIGKVLNLGFCMLRGSKKERAEKLQNHIATSIEKLKHGVPSEDIWKKRSEISELEQGNDPSGLPTLSKAIGKSPLSKATSFSLIATAEGILASARENKRKSFRSVTTSSEPPFKKPKEIDLAMSLPLALTSSTDATIVTLPVQSPSIDVTGSPIRDSTAFLQQALVLNSPFEVVPPPSRTEIPCASRFEELLTSILRSPANVLLSSSETSSLSKETLTYLLQHLILIGSHLFNFQQSSSLSSQHIEVNSSLSEKVSNLEAQIHGLQSGNESLSAEKTTAMNLLDLEKKRSQELEDKVKVLEDTLARTQQEIFDLKVISARVPVLEKELDKKYLSIGKLKSSLHAVKSKVSSFLNDVLPRWNDQSSEAVLFTAYRDNIDRCPDMHFPSLRTTGMDYKRKFDILLDRIPGDYSEFEDVASIDPAKFLALDDLPLDDDDEESRNDDEDKSDDDDNTEVDGAGDSARNNSSRKDRDDDSNQGGFGASQDPSHTFDFPSFDVDKRFDKTTPPRNSSGGSAPPGPSGLGQSPSDAPQVRSFRPSTATTPPQG